MKRVLFALALMTAVASTAYTQNASEKSQQQDPQSALGEFKVQGITWHAVTLKKEKFDSYRNMLEKVMNLKPLMEMDGVRVYAMENGSIIEIYLPDKVPAYKYNGDIAFGFRVTDIEAASKALEKAGYKMLGQITDVKEMKYKFRHFTGPDGLVYGLNEQN